MAVTVVILIPWTSKLYENLGIGFHDVMNSNIFKSITYKCVLVIQFAIVTKAVRSESSNCSLYEWIKQLQPVEVNQAIKAWSF